MRRHTILWITVLFLSLSALVWAQSRRARREKPTPQPTPATMKASAKPQELPPQPRTDQPALPDIVVKEIRFSGGAGAWAPGQTCNVTVVPQNIGQFETGVFLLQLDVRVQVPSERKDETVKVGVKRVASIPPRKGGASTGTTEVQFNYRFGNYDWAQYTFTATADSTNHIEEFDEANNIGTGADQTVDTHR
ncbi:hypothetical protein JW916_07735 [Candidatus Sumerlaeota bacterium]|nr:hypothetical protein [Candidatus Sumerlaeota bacterium]